MHIVKAIVYRRESALVGNVFIDLDLTVQVICRWSMRIAGRNLYARVLTLDEARELGSSFNTTEGGSSPCSPGHQLKSARRVRLSYRQVEVYDGSDIRASGNFLPCSSDSNDCRNSPSLMTSLEGSAHNVDLPHLALAPEATRGTRRIQTFPVASKVKSNPPSVISTR